MKFSKDGYKRNSKDINNPYNIIASGNITMKDVDFPVFGIDNLGNIEIMMPGGEYKFPGDSVFEIPLAQVGEEVVVPVEGNKLVELEKKINAYLNNPGQRAKDFSESEEELSNIDNLRHSMAGRYTAEELQNLVKGIPYIGGVLDATGVDKLVGFLGSNVLGIGHEVSTLAKDERPLLASLQESGEDVFNNFVGSIVGSTNLSSERKDNMLKFLSYNNLLPDGYVQTDPDFSENVYFKDSDGNVKKANFDSYEDGGGFMNQIKAMYDDAMVKYKQYEKEGYKLPSHKNPILNDLMEGYIVRGGFNGEDFEVYDANGKLDPMRTNLANLYNDITPYIDKVKRTTKKVRNLLPFQIGGGFVDIEDMPKEEEIDQVDVSKEKQELLEKLNSQTFLDRYKKNWFRVTGEEISDENAKANIQNQIDFTGAGADYGLVFPYNPDGSFVYSPYSNIQRQYAIASYERRLDNNMTKYVDGDFVPKTQDELREDGSIYPDAYNYPYMTGYQYDQFGNIKPGVGSEGLGPRDVIVHELAHSYNTGKSKLWDSANYSHPALKEDGSTWSWSNFGHFDAYGGYKDFLGSIFGQNYLQGRRGWRGHAEMPAEISSAKAETETRLKDAGIWDYNQSAFSSTNLDNMLNQNFKMHGRSKLDVGESDLHLESIGYNDLLDQHNIVKEFNKDVNKLSKINDLDENYWTNIKGNFLVDDNWFNIEQYIDDFGLENAYDSKDLSAYVNLANKGLKEKHQFNSIDDAYNVLNETKDKRFKKKEHERAKTFINTFMDNIKGDINKSIEEESEKQNIKLQEKRNEVEPKMKMYFNEIVMDDQGGDGTFAKHGTELPRYQDKGQVAYSLSVPEVEVNEPLDTPEISVTPKTPEVSVTPKKSFLDKIKSNRYLNAFYNNINPLLIADNTLQALSIPSNIVRESIEGIGGKGDAKFNFGDIVPDFFNTTILDNDKKQQPVSDVLGVEGFVPSLLVDLATDPTTYVGAGVLKNVIQKGGRKTVPQIIKTLDKTTPGGGDMFVTLKAIADANPSGAKKLKLNSDRRIQKLIKNDPDKAQRIIDNALINDDVSFSKVNFLDNVKTISKDRAANRFNYEKALGDFGAPGLPGVQFKNVESFINKLGDYGTTTLFRYGEGPLNTVQPSGAKFGYYSADPFDVFRYDEMRRGLKSPNVYKIDLDNSLLTKFYKSKDYGKASMYDAATRFTEFEVPEFIINKSNLENLGKVDDYRKYLRTLKKHGGQSKAQDGTEYIAGPDGAPRVASDYKDYGSDINFDDLEKGIRFVESLNGVLMLNPESSATGLYGQLWEEVEDMYSGSRQEFSEDIDFQKDLFRKRAYGEIEGIPGLLLAGEEVYDEYKNVDHGLSKLEISALSNFLGRQGVREYIGYHIRDGRSLESVFPKLYGENAKYTNKTPGEYLKKFREGLLKGDNLRKGGSFMKKMNRIKEQLDLYNKGKEISGIAKKELEIRGLIQKPIKRVGGSVPVKEGDYLGKIARKEGFTVDEILQFNPHIKDRKDLVIYPGERIYFDFETKNYVDAGTPTLNHTVQPGDVLSQIALDYDVEVAEIAKLNNIVGDKIHNIYPGDQLILPEHAKYKKTEDIKKQQRIANSPVTEIDSVVVNAPSPVNEIWVKRKFNLNTGRYDIVGGKKYNIDQLNSFDNYETIIKGKNDSDRSTKTTEVYTVQSGDTLSEIAEMKKVHINTLIADNNIINPSDIKVGQKITINKNTTKPYLIVDKRKSKMHLLYPGESSPRESYDILTGTMEGDQATTTKSDYYFKGKKLSQQELNEHMEDNGVNSTRELLNLKLDGKPIYTTSTDYYAGNRMTGAGKYTISLANPDGGSMYRGDAAPGEKVPSFNLVNEQGIEQALAIHGVTPSRTRSLYDDDPTNNRLTSGCINGKCEDLQSLYDNPDVTEGTEVYILPERDGSNFVYENGKLNFYTLRENQKEARKGYYKTKANKNRYSGKGGDEGEFVEGGPGINVTTNFGNYKPILFEFDKSLHQSEGASNPSVQADGSVANLNEEFRQHTQPFLSSLAENKKRVMETINIDGDLYNDIALVAFGIYGNESGVGDINPLSEDIPKLANKAFVSIANYLGADYDSVGSGSVLNKYYAGFRSNPENSVGWTQLRVGDGMTGPNEREALARYDEKYKTNFTKKITDDLSQNDLRFLEEYDEINNTNLYAQAKSNNNKGRIYKSRLGEVQYHMYDIDNKVLLDPKNSAIITALILGERYKNQISRNKKNSPNFDIYHELAKTWRPGKKANDYAGLVNSYIPLVTLRESDIDNIDKNVIVKGEYNRTPQTQKDGIVENLEKGVKFGIMFGTPLPTFLAGGEFGLKNQIQFYKDYVEGLYENTKQEKSAKKLYDKLNRMYYSDYRGTDSNALDIMNLMNSGTNN